MCRLYLPYQSLLILVLVATSRLVIAAAEINHDLFLVEQITGHAVRSRPLNRLPIRQFRPTELVPPFGSLTPTRRTSVVATHNIMSKRPRNIEVPLSSLSSHPPDLPKPPVEFSGMEIELRLLAQLPREAHNIISLTTRPGDDGLYVTTQEGNIYRVREHTDGSISTTLWFDVSQALETIGRPLYFQNPQTGLRSLAFHPDFATPDTRGYGKLFTSFIETSPPHATDNLFLGDRLVEDHYAGVSVLAEWTFDHRSGQVHTTSYRPLFRVQSPVSRLLHMIKQVKFNPYSQPGEEDYGLLYITHGDASDEPATGDYSQLLNNALGKMLRIQPLQSGELRYEIPATNPFVQHEDPSILPEIYAYGFRNPHTFSFNLDSHGRVHILLGDIGRNNIEEVNLITAGKNYGWPYREGPYVHRQLPDSHPESGYLTGITALPPSEAELEAHFTYPVAVYDHVGTPGQKKTSHSIATGHVVKDGVFVFANFSRGHGHVYHADIDEMVQAITELTGTEPSQEDPPALTQAAIWRLSIWLDHARQPGTAPEPYDDLLGFINSRADVRFGRGPTGSVMSTKRTGRIYSLRLRSP